MSAEKQDDKPEHIAVALRYDTSVREVPDVVGKGTGELANRILELAAENDIPVRKDPDLLELLAGVQVGETIPEDLYEVVAEVLAYLYRINDSLS